MKRFNSILLLLSIMPLSYLCANSNFDQSYFNFGYGFGSQNYSKDSSNKIFNKYKKNLTLGWGHFFTNTTAYELQYVSSKGDNNNLALLTSEDFLGITLGEDLTVNTTSTLTQVSLLIKQLFIKSEHSFGSSHLIGTIGYSRGAMTHKVGVGDTNNNLTPFTLRSNSFYPSFALGVLLEPYNSAISFTVQLNLDAAHTLGTSYKSINDSTSNVLGTGSLSPKDNLSLNFSLQYLF